MNALSLFRYDNYVVIFCFLLILVFRKKLIGVENIIIVLLFLNILADIISAFILNAGYTSTAIYSVLFPTEIILWFVYYYLNPSRKEGVIYIFLVTIVFLFSLVNFLFIQKNLELNSYTIIPLSVLIFITSYLKLRRAIQEDEFHLNSILSWVLIANIVYYGLVIESITAMMVSIKSKIGDPRSFLKVNYAAYAVWSILLCIGCLIKKK